MSNALVTLKRIAEALPQLERVAEDTASLAAVDPANLELQRELGAAYQRLAVVQRHASRFDAALESSRKEIAVIDALVSRDAERSVFQQDAAIARAQRAMTHLGRGAVAEAKVDFLAARDALQNLAGKLDSSGQKWLASITAALSELENLQKKPAR